MEKGVLMEVTSRPAGVYDDESCVSLPCGHSQGKLPVTPKAKALRTSQSCVDTGFCCFAEQTLPAAFCAGWGSVAQCQPLPSALAVCRELPLPPQGWHRPSSRPLLAPWCRGAVCAVECD